MELTTASKPRCSTHLKTKGNSSLMALKVKHLSVGRTLKFSITCMSESQYLDRCQ